MALLVLVWLLGTAWMRPLAVPDEGRYAGVAWEMIRSGDWLTPTLNGLPFFHKPPLFYWLTAASLKVFGLTVWAARLASVLGALSGALALHGLVRRWAGPRLAGWALLVLITQPFYFGGAQYANLDMLVAGCITVTVVLAAHAVLAAEAGQSARPALWAAYAFAGLGLLAKGLIGLVLPGAVMLLWLAWTRRWRAILGLLSLPGIVIFGLVAAPWFIAMQRLYPDFFHYFFIYQHFQRFTQTGFNNMHAWWYYLPLMAGLALPWSLAWLTTLWPRTGHDQGSVALSTDPDPLRALMWIWLIVIVGFFSLPASKLPGYVLPALPPLAYLMAQAIDRRWAGRRVLEGVTALAALACLGLIGAAVHYDTQSARPTVPVVRPLLQQGVPLVYVDGFVYDLPFYLAQPAPIPVISNWDDPHIPQHDNDRKELFDAGAFHPDLAQQVLVPKKAWHQWLCAHPRLIVMAAPEVAAKYPELTWQAPVMKLTLWSLWVLDRDHLRAQGLVCGASQPS